MALGPPSPVTTGASCLIKQRVRSAVGGLCRGGYADWDGVSLFVWSRGRGAPGRWGWAVAGDRPRGQGGVSREGASRRGKEFRAEGATGEGAV